MRWGMVFCLLLSLASWAADTLIVPGRRVGPVALGEPIESVTRKLGAGRSFRSKDYTNLLYTGFTVVVNNTGRQTIQSVVVTDPPFHLKNGIGVGSTEDNVARLMGKPTSTQSMTAVTGGAIDKAFKYQKLGLFINVARSKVVELGIYAPGGTQ